MSGSSSESEHEHDDPPTKKRRTRGRTWSDDEVRSLIELWKKYAKEEKEYGSKLDFKEKLVRKLAKAGYNRSIDQVTKKMDNLRNEFKTKSKPSTGSAGGVWKWRKELVDLLRDDYHSPDVSKYRETRTPATETQDAAGPSTPSTISIISDDESPAAKASLSPVSFHRSRKTTRESSMNHRFLDLYKRDVEVREKMEKHQEEMVKTQKLLLEVLVNRQQQSQQSHAPMHPQSDPTVNQACNCGRCSICVAGSSFFGTGFNSDLNQSYHEL